MMSLPAKLSASEIEFWLISKLAASLRLAPDEIDTREPFSNYGLNSAEAVSLAGDLEEWLGFSLSPTLVWEFPSIESLATYLAAKLTTGESPDQTTHLPSEQFNNQEMKLLLAELEALSEDDASAHLNRESEK